MGPPVSAKACWHMELLAGTGEDVKSSRSSGFFIENDPTSSSFHPVIQDLKDYIEGNVKIYTLFHQMFAQIPTQPPYDKDPLGMPQVRDYKSMLEIFNLFLTRAPPFCTNPLVGAPFNTVLNWGMGTRSGFAVFLDEGINEHFRRILNQWARFLASPESRYVLRNNSKNGWFGETAMREMPDFNQTFLCDPSAPYRGFTSWDDFFTRRIRPGARPIVAPDDDCIIINACESAPYRIASDVKASDQFWVKSQPYSLQDMLADDSLAGQFTGGTVYQAYLDSTCYHRWHSPVDGKIVKAYVQPGAYFSASRAAGLDPVSACGSLGYLTEVAARAMIFIQARNPDVGLMCFMAVGMGEISTCEIIVCEGQDVRKGDQLGMFHYGGSTYCLIFRPSVALEWEDNLQLGPGPETLVVKVNAQIARVKPKA